MSTYAAYYHLATVQRQQELQHAADIASGKTSRRTSADSTSSRFSIKSALNQLRPTSEKLTPAGIYRPIINKGPLFSGMKPTETAEEPTPIYQRERSLFGRSKKQGKEPRHSVTQAAVEGALLRR